MNILTQKYPSICKHPQIPTVDKAFFYLLFVICFIVGGSAQFLGIISNTATTIILISMYSVYLMTKVCFTMKVKWSFIFIVLMLFSLDIVISGKIHHRGGLRTFIYLLYALVPFCSFYFINEYVTSDNIKSILRYFIIISIVQLPVLIFQYSFYPYLMAITRVQVRDEDIGFGTFFLKADAAMGTFILFLIVFILFDKRSSFIKNKNLLVAWLILTLTICGSKISILLLFLIFLGGFISKHRKNYALMIGFTLCISLFFVKYSGPLLQAIVSEYSRVDSWENVDQVPRYAPLLIFASKPISFLGDGPFTFYDPVTNNWLYGGGHSLWYFLYSDLGVLGLFLSTLIFYLMSKHGAKRGSNCSSIYFFIIMIVSLFTTSMSDISMMFIYSFYLGTWKIDLFREHGRLNLETS